MRERDRERQRERQRERERDGQTDRQTDRQADRQTDWWVRREDLTTCKVCVQVRTHMCVVCVYVCVPVFMRR